MSTLSRRRITWATPLLVIAAATMFSALAAVSRAEVRPGDPAPDFTLQDISGSSYQLSSYRGKLLLLDFVGYG